VVGHPAICRNGVKIISTPVPHYNTLGPVALRLEWNGLSVVYSGGWVGAGHPSCMVEYVVLAMYCSPRGCVLKCQQIKRTIPAWVCVMFVRSIRVERGVGVEPGSAIVLVQHMWFSTQRCLSAACVAICAHGMPKYTT
jgi:hypothetical protein